MHTPKLKKLRHRRTPIQLAKRKERISWRRSKAKILVGIPKDPRRKWL